LSRAAVSVGSDGLIIEVHIHPEDALSDGAQSLTPDGFGKMVPSLRAVAQAVGRSL
ncbi:MAG: 3-deoxy-7-phosphoheptulonate synthase, partial [Candidatus Omnitrophota bacterium]